MNHAPALDDATKRRLKTVVLDLRKLLEADLAKQLRRLGVDGKKTAPTPIEKLEYLTDEERKARRAVDLLIEREKRIARSFPGAVASIVREAAYTHLNRLVGLKCIETRGFLTVDGERTEAVTVRAEHGGRPKLLWAMREGERRFSHGEGAEERLWREGLTRAFRAVTEEIRVLFDPEDPYALVWPSFACLQRVVGTLNDLPEVVFRADESLGWIYQFFQTEEKARVFEEVRTRKKKIQWHDTIPVTSLYTERYMVDFLLQNSIGALWMEMHPDSPLGDSWPYYVEPASPRTRAPKAVKEWCILDPACGSGHFLVVAFDLLRQLYAEERRLAEEGKVPADRAVPEEDVAETILRENLHGIDIDPRSVQLSALALWLKAREAGLTGPPVLNLVVADCVLGKGEAHQELMARYRDAPEVQKAIQAIWDALGQMRELGTLIRVEEELEAAVKKAQRKEAGTFPEFQMDWETYRKDLISGLREAFEAEAKMEDLGHRLFGIEGQKGVDFVEIVSRRYDVVCTNPPYMGSKNMGKVLKDFVSKRYAPGKRDLYAAFILRCRELAAENGYVAMVTQQSWMFLRAYSSFRAIPEERLERRAAGPSGILRDATLQTLAHLGANAFGEISGEVVNVVLLVASTVPPTIESSATAFRVIGHSSPDEKDHALLSAIKNTTSPERHRFKLLDLLNVPDAPVVYWPTPRMLEALASDRRLGSYFHAGGGVGTRWEARFLRFFWETDGDDRWVLYVKGGGYRKWQGFTSVVVDWKNDGEEVKAYIIAKYPYLNGNYGFLIRDEKWHREAGLTYTDFASACFSARLLDDGLHSDGGPGIFPHDIPRVSLAALLNARVSTYFLRCLSPGATHFRWGYVENLPAPREGVLTSKQFEGIANCCVELKRALVATDPIERAFHRASVERLLSFSTVEHEHMSALLHVLEGWGERLAFESFALGPADIKAVLTETGTPAGWFPLVQGYDRASPLPGGLAELPDGFAEFLSTHERVALDPSELASVKARLRVLYEAGPGATVAENTDNCSKSSSDGEDENGTAAGAYIPIPTETFIEELSQKLQIHPISVYWLLEELRREEGVVCRPELKRHVEDFFSVTILRMLGHRWPEQDRYDEEQGHPMIEPKWVDEDGIIPLAPCAGERSLIERLRRYLDEKFGPENGPNVETEAGQILGKSLEKWIERDFFKRHVKQFKKRPIAWHLNSDRGTFQAIVCYHKFDRDPLHALRARYVKDTLQDLRSQLGEERKKSEGSRQAVKLEEQIAEVEAFDQKLRRLLEGNDRDYRIWVPWKEADQQPQGWRPDVNDGVRVNIAPVQRVGILAAGVLSAKDLKSLRAPEAEA